MKKLIVFTLCALFSVTVQAQITIKGHVVNARHEGVEYVTIGFEGDSIGTISDAEGHFTLTIPQKRADELVFTHVSYVPQRLSPAAYASGRELQVELQDKVVELSEVVVGKKNKAMTIAKKSMTGPVASLRGKGKSLGLEWGPVFKCKKDCVVSDLILKVISSSYGWCVLSFNIYEQDGSKLRNVLNKPIYYRFDKPSGRKELIIQPEQNIVLKRKKKYFVSLAVVDSDAYGILNMQSQLKSSLARRLSTGKVKKIPCSPAIIVKGTALE